MLSFKRWAQAKENRSAVVTMMMPIRWGLAFMLGLFSALRTASALVRSRYGNLATHHIQKLNNKADSTWQSSQFFCCEATGSEYRLHTRTSHLIIQPIIDTREGFVEFVREM